MHIYEKNGHKYPSVTTVLHIIGDEGICNWANSLGYRHISYNIYNFIDPTKRYYTV